jgi:soluble lytic murein transglycosylase
MQLMPKTASLMHKKVYGTAEAEMGNAADPTLNLTLGQNYVEHLLGNNLVDGNMVYLLTAYNAGPGRLQEWKKTIGNGKDPLLFIESIPVGQTRNYVMQVLTNYWIYSELVGDSNGTVTALLQNKWPSYEAYAGPVAENLPKVAADNNGV